MKIVDDAGIQAGGEPVDHHVPDIALQLRGVLVTRRQRVDIGDEEIALVLVLQLHPVLERAVIVTQMECTCRSHAGQDASVGGGSRAQCLASGPKNQGVSESC